MPINYSKWDAIGSSDDEATDAADRRDVEAMLRGAVDMDPMERKFYEARLGEDRVRPPPPPGAVSKVQASGADAAIASARATPMRREAFQLMDEARRAHMIGDIDTAVSKAGAAYVHDEKGCIILGGEDFARDIKQAAERISARGASADRELYVRAEVLLANLAILAGDTASSVHHQRRAVEARPKSFRLRTHLAAFYACDQRLALARQALEEALARVDAGGAIDDPSPDAEASARFNLARCDHGLRRHGEAVEGFRAYVGRDREASLADDRALEDTARALYMLGVSQAVCNRDKDAVWTTKELFARATRIEARMSPAARGAVASDRMSLQMLVLTPDAPPTPPAEEEVDEARDARFYEGDRVVIGGLTSAKGKTLNGRKGTIAAVPSRLRPRYGVRVGGKRYDILGKNLEREGTDECSICLGPFRSPVALGCGHRFCADCLAGCRAQGVVDCALCRRELSPWDHDAVRKAMRDARAKARWGADDAPADEDPHEQSALHAVAEATRAYGRRPDGQEMDVVLRQEFEARRAKAGGGTPVPPHEMFREADGSNDPVIRRACEVEMNRNDPRGDGDQSPLSGFPGSPGADLEMLWGCGGNFNPFERPDRYSVFLKCCAWGDAREVEAMLALATDAEAREKLLETRESNLRFNALRACITGARNKPGTFSPADARCGGWPLDGAARSRLEREPPNHPRVAELLLAAGARLDARDVIGNTHLHGAAGSHATETSLAIAAQILDRAGDNATALLGLMNRLGNTVLSASVTHGRADVVAFLLSRGADPLQRNRPDPKMPLTPNMRTMAVHHGHQEVVRLLDAAAKGKTRKPRKGKKGRGRK